MKDLKMLAQISDAHNNAQKVDLPAEISNKIENGDLRKLLDST